MDRDPKNKNSVNSPKGDETQDWDDFASAMQDVAPLTKGKQTFAPKAPTAEEDLQARKKAAEEFASEPEADNFLTLGEVKARDPLEVLEWRQDGIQLAVFDKLRKGGYDIARELDLHQRTVKEAHADVYQLIGQAHAKDWRCVLISHGKGLRSPTPARLKSYVAHWLIQHPLVLAYCSAQRHRGGTGSVYALIKKSPRSSEENRERFGQKSDL
jgi:DNA-nicking Smr family endonuclease